MRGVLRAFGFGVLFAFVATILPSSARAQTDQCNQCYDNCEAAYNWCVNDGTSTCLSACGCPSDGCTDDAGRSCYTSCWQENWNECGAAVEDCYYSTCSAYCF